ncbi:hypothetical protein [Pacificispira sp.]|uniref:hypothetical protein n=1 Tax=Pacificispira sp. TaxID=2888761 RepID=UPI003B52EDE4
MNTQPTSQPSIADEHLRVAQMMSGLTLSWPIQMMNRALLAEIESRGSAGEPLMLECARDLKRYLGAIQQPEDYSPVAQAYAVYAEALAYILLDKRKVRLERTPGTGGHGQKRPDFLHKHSKGDVYFEVKCLDFQGGVTRHKNLADDALEVAADLDGRAHQAGVHSGVLEISAFDETGGPAERIETLIDKTVGNLKGGQLKYGPCILIVDMGRLQPEAQHPCSLLPVYYNDGFPSPACVSGELWHVALGRMGDMIYQLPEFEGKSNLTRTLQREGVLHQHPELLGISFILPRLSREADIYSIWNEQPDLTGVHNACGLSELEIGEFISSYSDAMNDTQNTYGFEYVRRP